MSLEAILAITEAEEKARQLKSDAAARAKQMLADAKTAGEEYLNAAVKKAETEIAGLTKKAEDKAKADATELAQSNENKKAALRAKAETRLDKAADLIVERIVNG